MGSYPITAAEWEQAALNSADMAQRLLAEKDQAQARVLMLENVLSQYGRHDPECRQPCECGWEEAWQVVLKGVKKP